MKVGFFFSSIAATCLLIGCSTAGPPLKIGGDGTSVSRLVGTWQVLEFRDTDAAGKISYAYGEHPTGYIVYDATGRVHIQVMRTPATPPFAKDDAHGTDQEVRSAYDGYIAYFGTYDFDEAQGTVIHRVQGSLMPSYTGTDQPRPIRIVGDDLVIEGKTPEGSFYRHLRRMR